MKKLIFATMFIVVLSSFHKIKSLKGTWEYAGGVVKGKHYPAPKTYSQQRKYTDTQFEAFLLEKGEKPLRYEGGNYTLKPDSCLETQTYSLQASDLAGKTIHYWYTIQKDTLVLKGTLPNGTVIEDYWKKIK